MKRISKYKYEKAKKYFLKKESYCSFDLPQYFSFQDVLDKVDEKIGDSRIEDFFSKKPYDFDDINYKLLNNKDGKFDWRQLQLINPALYVSLVNIITKKNNWKTIKDRFKKFGKNRKIICESIPLESEDDLSDKATSIRQWWNKIEQQSIELAMEYDYILHTDITDCYGSIYTHSIPWALHTKETAKKKKGDKKLVGNIIDKHLQYMTYGQTNGIPEGSVLMDFIAEIVLGDIDLNLSDKIKDSIKDYRIIRYRDDYRIFTNNPQDGTLIVKLLTETLIEFGMRLNAQKTIVSNNVIRDSIKPDKLYWMTSKNSAKNLQAHLLIIHDLSERFRNSGRLIIALDKFYKKIKGLTKTHENVKVLISIILDIAYKNPRTYPYATAILSKLLSLIETKEKTTILKLIKNKFKKLPNTGHLQIWLQRIAIKINPDMKYDEKLCLKLNDNSIEIWNTEWLNNEELKKIIVSEKIIDEQIIENMDEVINPKEIELFNTIYYE